MSVSDLGWFLRKHVGGDRQVEGAKSRGVESEIVTAPYDNNAIWFEETTMPSDIAELQVALKKATPAILATIRGTVEASE